MKKLASIFALVFVFSCTNLQETPFSEYQTTNYFTNEAAFEKAIVPAYSNLRNYTWQYWNLSQVSGNETTITGQHTFGEYISIYQRSFRTNDPLFDELWKWLYEGVGSCNNVLFMFKDLPQSKEKTQFTAEVRVLRAFYYYLLIDTFGNVPLIIAYPAPENVAQSNRKAVFAFCEKELLEGLNDLDKTKKVYGRVNNEVANTILAKLYLNAEVYTGIPKWKECLEVCNKISLGNPALSLTKDYYDNFKLHNETSTEIIFPIGFSSGIDLGFPNNNFYMRTLHYNQTPASPWNGLCTIAEYYDSFDSTDYRRAVLWEGKQFSPMTWPKNNKIGTPLKTRTGAQMSFSKVVSAIGNTEDAGIRVPKYQPDIDAPGGQAENDFVIFRFADVLLMKAEALFKLNQETDALIEINKIRERATLKPLAKLTLNDILKERQHEFFWEGFARQDLIRFGEFLKPNSIRRRTSEPHKTLFPIPERILANNPNFVQNVGY